jgi:hypothetical protein
VSIAPFFQLVIVVFITSFIIAVIWVYVRPQPDTTPPDDERLSEAELRRRADEERRRRLDAQERLFAGLERERIARERRDAINRRPYLTADLPSHLERVTVVSMMHIEDDVYRAFAYLLDGWPDDAEGDFEHHWRDFESPLWAWQGDNLLDDYGEDALLRTVRERHRQMVAALRAAGWRESHAERPSEYVALSYYQAVNPAGASADQAMPSPLNR